MSTPEECEGAKPKVSLSDRGLVRTSCSHDVGPHMEADDGHATHWVWHFSMQVHCKPRRNVQKQCSLARVGARDIWRPTTVTQPIEFGTSACKCTTSLVEKSRSNAASPGLVPETSCRPSTGVMHCKPVDASVAHVAGKSCRQVTLCRHWLRVSYRLQAEAAGITHGAVAACGCRSASNCCGCCTLCRPSRGWHTRCRHGLRVAYQAEGSTHWAAVGCGCLATRCGQGCGYFTLCRQRFEGKAHVAAKVASVSRGELVRAISHRRARGNWCHVFMLREMQICKNTCWS